MSDAKSIDLSGAFAPVFSQAMRGTCVAAAVTGLVEYFEGFRHRLSVQYLHEAIRRVSAAWAKRNSERLRAGELGDEAFEKLYRRQLVQIRLVGRMKGFDSPEALNLIELFEANIAERIENLAGSPIAGAFGALRQFGICRYSLWPYAQSDSSSTLGAIPPGADDDAARHRFGERELYLLRTPGNVDEIRGILSGANGYRPMPVAASVAIFEGCTGNGRFSPPGAEAKPSGAHAVLITGFRDDSKLPGGGEFVFRNSWGDAWGEKGYGRMSYAYFESHAEEAGTILHHDFSENAAGYGEMRNFAAGGGSGAGAWVLNLAVAAALVAATACAVTWLNRPPPPPPPQQQQQPAAAAPETPPQTPQQPAAAAPETPSQTTPQQPAAAAPETPPQTTPQQPAEAAPEAPPQATPLPEEAKPPKPETVEEPPKPEATAPEDVPEPPQGEEEKPPEPESPSPEPEAPPPEAGEEAPKPTDAIPAGTRRGKNLNFLM